MEWTPQAIINLVIAAATMGGAWLVTSWRTGRNERDFENHKKVIWDHVDRIKEWQVTHQRDSTAERISLQSDISAIQISQARSDERFIAIMGTLKTISEDIKSLQKEGCD